MYSTMRGEARDGTYSDHLDKNSGEPNNNLFSDGNLPPPPSSTMADSHSDVSEEPDESLTVGMKHSFHNAADLFSPSLLDTKDATTEVEGLRLRPLRIDDYDKGYLQLLAQLTTVGLVSPHEFQNRFHSMQSSTTSRQQYFVVVVEDVALQQVVGSASLVLEFKFIHRTGIRGRIEDVVVEEKYRGRQLGKLLLQTLTLLAKELGCYKISLECKDKLIKFYETFGYKKDEGNNFLVQRIRDD